MAASATLVINASPRKTGKCATLARLVASQVRYDCACVFDQIPDTDADEGSQQADVLGGEEPALVHVADLDINPCRGCNGCEDTPGNACVIRDDMDDVMDMLDEAQRLIIVSPVFFAGPPSQLKALLDRLQPHFYRGTRSGQKKPAELYVVGDGGDPHGFAPLETICRSALAVAGYRFEAVHPCIGVDKQDLPGFVEQEANRA